MTGRCYLCENKCVAIPGPSNHTKRIRASSGWRIGYVIEARLGQMVDDPRLICAECLHHSLPSDVAA